MALTTEQKISLLSDTVLYSEATLFIRKLVKDDSSSLPKSLIFLQQLVETEGHCDPLPTSQVTGLLSIARASRYVELEKFVRHQRDRNWTGSRSNIKQFYTALEKFLSNMKRERLKNEFHLGSDGLPNKEASREADELMARLAHDFIQHLVAENGLLAQQEQARRGDRRGHE